MIADLNLKQMLFILLSQHSLQDNFLFESSIYIPRVSYITYF